MKSLKQFVYETLEQKGYITDTDVYKFTGNVNSLVTAEEYRRSFKRLERDRDFARKTGKIIACEKGHRAYYVEFERGMYKVGKEFYLETKNKLDEEWEIYTSANTFLYNGYKLYNIKKMSNLSGHEIRANYDVGGETKLGNFYKKDLVIKALD